MSQIISPKKRLSVREVSLSSISQLDIDKVSETPLLPLNWRELFFIAYTLVKSGLSTSITFITTFLISLVSYSFVGKYGTPSELAGTTLASTIQDVLSIAILNSINEGFGIMSSQVFGAKKYREVGLLYQRNLCILLAIAIPSIILMFFTDYFLLAIGLAHDVSINTGIYLKYTIPSIIGLNVFGCTRFYLISQEQFFAQGAIQFVTTILHFFWCMLFVGHMGMSVKGAAIAKSITDVLSAIFLVIYVWFNKRAHRCSIPWTKECLQKWYSHLKEALAIGGSTYIEWIATEFSIFSVSFLNNEFIIGAHGAAFSLGCAFFSITHGNSIAMQAYVGNSVGEGHKHKAQKFMIVGVVLGFIYAFINAIIYITLSPELAKLFTNDSTTQGIFVHMFKIYSCAVVIDVTVNHLSGLIRTVGKEKEVINSFIFSYIIVGISCQLIFGVVLNYGYFGVWVSIDLGMYTMFILMLHEVLSLDWKQVILDVKAKVNLLGDLDEKSLLLSSEPCDNMKA